MDHLEVNREARKIRETVKNFLWTITGKYGVQLELETIEQDLKKSVKMC